MTQDTSKISDDKSVCAECEEQFQDQKTMWEHRGCNHPSKLKKRLCSYESLTRQDSLTLNKIESMLSRKQLKKKSEQTPCFGDNVLSKQSSLVERSRNKGSLSKTSGTQSLVQSSGAKAMSDAYTFQKRSSQFSQPKSGVREFMNSRYQEMRIRKPNTANSYSQQQRQNSDTSFQIRKFNQSGKNIDEKKRSLLEDDDNSFFKIK